MAVKLGPLRMSYKGKVTVEDVDEANHSARLAASGRDTKGAGTAKASVETRLEAAGDTRTRLHVTSDVQLTGKVASFGRGGAINDVATRLFGQFADCLRATLEAEQAGSGATAPPSDRPERPGPTRRPRALHPGRVRSARPRRAHRVPPRPGTASQPAPVEATATAGAQPPRRDRTTTAPPRPPRPGPPRRWTPGAWSGP